MGGERDHWGGKEDAEGGREVLHMKSGMQEE